MQNQCTSLLFISQLVARSLAPWIHADGEQYVSENLGSSLGAKSFVLVGVKFRQPKFILLILSQLTRIDFE